MVPIWLENPNASAEDLAACRAMIRQGSRTFFAASLLLPATIRCPAYTLYAFCRFADDEVDCAGRECDALERLRERLALAYAGRPLPTPTDRAFADMVARYAIPRAIPEALLEGLAWDTDGRRYEDFSGVAAYSARVASTVGAMMTLLMGVRDPDVIARACDLGVAMQITNICRDVGEDARMGRIYLPLAWMREEGLDPDAWLADPVFDARLGRVVRRMLDAADRLYARSEAGIAHLPLPCRPGILAARIMYAEIGREVEKAGYDSVSRRAYVCGRRKLALLGRTFAQAPFVAKGVGAPPPPLDETRFLVDAVIASPLANGARPDPTAVPWWNFARRIAWVVDLFGRLEQRGPVGSLEPRT
ncbi:Phytoene synthase [Rhodovulum sp. PH10]|uniref:phytoene/squalene synthase family protein n=1 Tax=Rhodovulum sp. PH10 TaxID=1187851 RepID=UPI00027C231B|nr:phytoene/squalene synthase family protein [Rhodovulum sp. PH10]EJW12823.1 Phytoene synthase [Rhodovulum sp. PH10]